MVRNLTEPKARLKSRTHVASQASALQAREAALLEGMEKLTQMWEELRNSPLCPPLLGEKSAAAKLAKEGAIVRVMVVLVWGPQRRSRGASVFTKC